MILDAFGPDALPLIVSGGLGGLVRGLIVLRRAIAKAAFTAQVLTSTTIDTSTSVVIGACISLFLHGWVETLTKPILDMTSTDAAARELTSGFVGGFGCIFIAGLLWDFFSGIGKKPDQQQTPPPPVVTPAGTP